MDWKDNAGAVICLGFFFSSRHYRAKEGPLRSEGTPTIESFFNIL